MKTITKFKADDGPEFNTEAECLQYEHDRKEIEGIAKRLKPAPNTVSFSNGDGYVWQDRETVLGVQRDLARLVLRQFKHDGTYVPHIQFAMEATEPVGLSFIGRLIDDACPGPLNSAWSRICRIDKQFREWGQPYYALNPDKGKQHEVTHPSATAEPT